MDGVQDLVVRSRCRHLITEDCDSTLRRLLPVAPADVAIGRIGKDHAQYVAELTPRNQAHVGLPYGRTLGRRLILPFVTHRYFPARSDNQVQPRTCRPSILFERLGPVVVKAYHPG